MNWGLKSYTRGRVRAAMVGLGALALSGAMAVTPVLASHDDPVSPDDPLYAPADGLGQWGLGQINAEAAWHRATGTGAVIAIVDSGIDLDHEDLAAKILPGNTFTGCGESGCGNGDWESGPPGPFNEPSNHGTHVAGIAAAVTNNGVGVAGVAPDAKLLPVKVTTSLPVVEAPCFESGWLDIAHGIRFAADNGADVINLSLGNPVPGAGQACTFVDPAVTDAIAYASSKDVVVVAAAGNSDELLCGGPPGISPGALCVAATDSKELPAEYSNRPIKEDLLTVSAPGGGLVDYSISCGGGVLSTVPPGTGDAAIAETCGYPESLAYDELTGTSMASPHAAGVAALLKSQGCTRQEVLDLMTSTARTPGAEARGQYTPVYGYGIIDAAAATEAAAGACTPPVNSAPAAGADSASVDEDATVLIPVLSNDGDVDGDALSLTGVSEASKGAVSIEGDLVRYTPGPDLNGVDSFTYTISDGRGGSATGTVTVDVAAVNDAPIAVADTSSTRPNRTVSFAVVTNDRDVDGDELRVSALQAPANGKASVGPDGIVTYTPAKGFRGVDRFSYAVADPAGATSTATIEVRVG